MKSTDAKLEWGKLHKQEDSEVEVEQDIKTGASRIKCECKYKTRYKRRYKRVGTKEV